MLMLEMLGEFLLFSFFTLLDSFSLDEPLNLGEIYMLME
jgi:hypothetical protein